METSEKMMIPPLYAGLVLFAMGILVGMTGLGIPVATLVGLVVAAKHLLPLFDCKEKRVPPLRPNGRNQPKDAN
jgi:hypothetical protein